MFERAPQSDTHIVGVQTYSYSSPVWTNHLVILDADLYLVSFGHSSVFQVELQRLQHINKPDGSAFSARRFFFQTSVYGITFSISSVLVEM